MDVRSLNSITEVERGFEALELAFVECQQSLEKVISGTNSEFRNWVNLDCHI